MNTRALAAAVIVAAAVLIAPPATAATSPVPGRFCAAADRGKIVTTAKYGKVRCLMRGDRARWVDIAG